MCSYLQNIRHVFSCGRPGMLIELNVFTLQFTGHIEAHVDNKINLQWLENAVCPVKKSESHQILVEIQIMLGETGVAAAQINFLGWHHQHHTRDDAITTQY